MSAGMFDADQDLNIEVDLGGMTVGDVENFGKPIPPGYYHCVLDKIEKKDPDKKPYLQLYFTIHAGTSPDANGLKFSEKLYYHKEDAVLRRYMAFGDRLGLPMREGAGKTPIIPWGQAIGRQAVIQLQLNQYTDQATGMLKTNVKVPFTGIWNVANPEIAAVPKDKTLLEKLGLVHLYTPDLWARTPPNGGAAEGGAASPSAGPTPGGSPGAGAATAQGSDPFASVPF